MIAGRDMRAGADKALRGKLQGSAAPASCRLYQRHVVIMAKLPAMGRVKTRLGRDIGAVAATYFYRHAARAVMMRLSADRRWRTVLAVAPDPEVAMPAWPSGLARMGQGRGRLDARMQRIFDSSAMRGPILIVGTDIPSLGPAHIAAAFRKLDPKDAVFGPADDGGYWLVGLKRMPRVARPFEAVRWSSRYALADTLANLAGLRIGFAETLGDVDDAQAFLRVRGWAGRVVLPARQV